MFKKIILKLGSLSVGLVSLIYIFNPGAGIIEVIPDNIPGIGNLDEFVASIVMVLVLKYFGLDITKYTGRNKKISMAESSNNREGENADTKGL